MIDINTLSNVESPVKVNLIIHSHYLSACTRMDLAANSHHSQFDRVYIMPTTTSQLEIVIYSSAPFCDILPPSCSTQAINW